MFLKKALLICAVFSSGSVFAQERIETSSTPRYSATLSHPWHVFAGVGLGYGLTRSSEFSNNPDGLQNLFSLLMSHRQPTWLFDFGASWIYSKLSGNLPDDRSIDIRTRAATIDLSPRYRLTQHLQVGPILNIAFGTDTEFGPSKRSEIGTYFAGVKFAYEFAVGNHPIRLWQQTSTDLSISARQVYLAMAGIQVGFPVGPTTQDHYIETSRVPLRISAVMKKSNKLHLELDPQKVFFNTNSSNLKPEVALILKQVGAYLASDEGSWDSLDITGHADQRGSYKYNLKLSKKRAMSVSQSIAEGKLNSEKLHVAALSYSKPLDPKNGRDAWAMNRRVELIFRNVRAPEPLIKLVRPLMNASSPTEVENQ